LRHEFLAQMLGIHRPTVSIAANTLQKAGLIKYHYGTMTIVDPDGLREGACECYETMEKHFDKIFELNWRTSAVGRDQPNLTPR
jgi:Mn-dependent DtxR family transcriptional regulator